MKIRKYDKINGIERKMKKGEIVLDLDRDYIELMIVLENDYFIEFNTHSLEKISMEQQRFFIDGWSHNDFSIYELYEEE